MRKQKGIIILHLDGLGYEYLQKALIKNKMPFVQTLIDKENYTIGSYRCGLPSTTPCIQAAVLYGNKNEIPAFRWYDKEAGLDVCFGVNATFKHVAHKYFKGLTPLTKDGACIGACYPADAKETFAIAYKLRNDSSAQNQKKRLPLIIYWASNPFRIIDWLWHVVLTVLKMLLEYIRAVSNKESVSVKYFFSDLLEEIFIHHLTRFATGLAMKEKFPIIYSCFYAYDETSHSFGPDDAFSIRILSEIDKTIRYIAQKRHQSSIEYEIVIYSDHGQVATTPYAKIKHKTFGEEISALLPTYEVKDAYGKYKKDGDAIDGKIVIASSCGVAHLYFATISNRLLFADIMKSFPSLLSDIAKMPEIGFILVKDTVWNIIITKTKKLKFSSQKIDAETQSFLKQFGSPNYFAKQLDMLNSYNHSGDIIIYGAFVNDKQINFENQFGGHGGPGGAQMHPFLMSKKSWNINVEKITDATDLFTIFSGLRKNI